MNAREQLARSQQRSMIYGACAVFFGVLAVGLLIVAALA